MLETLELVKREVKEFVVPFFPYISIYLSIYLSVFVCFESIPSGGLALLLALCSGSTASDSGES